jgi:hypothetical protein
MQQTPQQSHRRWLFDPPASDVDSSLCDDSLDTAVFAFIDALQNSAIYCRLMIYCLRDPPKVPVLEHADDSRHGHLQQDWTE